MEHRFSHDFSRVRVHADAVAAESARALEAEAYTVGANVVFGQGMYQPRTEVGQRLLAHELAHALQQRMAPRPPSQLHVDPLEEAAEREAKRIGEQRPMGSTAAQDHGGRCACGRPTTKPGAMCTACASRRRDRGSKEGAGSTQVVETARTGIQRQQARPPIQGRPTRAGGGHSPAVDWRISVAAFNLVLQNEFPLVNSSWYLGTRSDLPAGGNVQADLASGRDGKVIFRVSPDFAPAGQRAQDTAVDPGHIDLVRREVTRSVEWRLAQGLLTAEDIAAPFVKRHLRSMAPLALRALRARPTVQPAAQAELDRLLAITTQLPESAQFTATGAAELTVGGLRVRILPDTRQGSGNRTSFRMVPSQVGTPGFTTAHGRVTALNGSLPTAPVIEIFTRYAAQGPQSARDPITATSAYGRGTTTADVAAGTTTLRFHESRHGEDFLDFIATNPFPTYTGRVGMRVADFRRAGTTFLAAVRVWLREMGRRSLCATDCVGSPDIDVFEHNQGRRIKCTTCHPHP